MKKPSLVVLSGAGMSKESGIRTFRETGGLWEEYDISVVASPMGWAADPELVTRFYNDRRRQLRDTQPNAGHTGLAELEKWFDVKIITQNVDDLHERAGSTSVLHLHGELTKARSTVDPDLIYDIGYRDLGPDDKCAKGSLLRPQIVWFGEAVPAIEDAIPIIEKADIFLIIGTSLNVYPAAGLINYAPPASMKFLIDPERISIPHHLNINVITAGASEGVSELTSLLKKKYALS